MQALKIEVPVERGLLKYTPEQSLKLARFLDALNGKMLTLKLERRVNPRSTNQNAYYWGVVLSMIAEHTGNEAEYMHDIFKGDFLTRQFIPVRRADGTVVEREVRKSTAKLSTVEFEEYLEKIRAWAAEFLGLVIPLPHESL